MTALSAIVEVNSEDNCVRYLCGDCGAITDWINPGPAVGHDCATGKVSQLTEKPARPVPCASSHINAAASSLNGSLAKLQHAQSRQEISETLERLAEWRRQALSEELSANPL